VSKLHYYGTALTVELDPDTQRRSSARVVSGHRGQIVAAAGCR